MSEYRRSIDVPHKLARKVSIAAASFHMSESSYIRAAISAAVEECADRDPILRLAFKTVDESEQAPVLSLRSEWL